MLLGFIGQIWVHAQNLVPNYSFEHHTGCPSTQGDLVKANGWKTVNGQTPDYFHPCGLALWYSAPDNSENFGYQDASNGVAYAGIRAWDKGWGPNIREYVGISLTSSLNPCSAYYVSFKVSRAEGPKSTYATDDLGIYFSNTVINTTDPVLSSFVPQVRKP